VRRRSLASAWRASALSVYWAAPTAGGQALEAGHCWGHLGYPRRGAGDAVVGDAATAVGGQRPAQGIVGDDGFEGDTHGSICFADNGIPQSILYDRAGADRNLVDARRPRPR
jgi:hypothetical protein